MARRVTPNRSTIAAFIRNCSAIRAGASAASTNILDSAVSSIAALQPIRLLVRSIEFGDKVVGVSAAIGLRKLDGAAVAQESPSFHEQAGVVLFRTQQRRLFGSEQNRAQSLQRARRTMS